jgi:glycerol-3-phosphate dehydrogenase (NAD(P)+)
MRRLPEPENINAPSGMGMNITVLGAGAWGTAVACAAVHAGQGHRVFLWGRHAPHLQAMQEQGCNTRYLPEVPLPPGLRLTADLSQALSHALEGEEPGLLVVGTPMSALSSMLERVAQACPPGQPGGRTPQVLWLCKGFETTTGRLGHELAQHWLAHGAVGVLSGPSFAREVGLRQPTALVVASFNESLNQMAVRAFHGDALRVYASNDPIGVEVGGAVKNVLAIATGIADGMMIQGREGLGLNARAALITRGLAEMTRLGVALGAQATTFMGLSGLGDLVLTATGHLSRNRMVGLGLARGQALQDILNELGHVAEGVHSAGVVWARAQACGVDMPITEAVVKVLKGTITPAQALEGLMARQARSEWG